MRQMKFYELAVGAVFTAWGRTYRKIAMSMAEDDRGWGMIFMGETEVSPEETENRGTHGIRGRDGRGEAVGSQ